MIPIIGSVVEKNHIQYRLSIPHLENELVPPTDGYRPATVYPLQWELGFIAGHGAKTTVQTRVAPVFVNLIDSVVLPFQKFLRILLSECYAKPYDLKHREYLRISRFSLKNGGIEWNAGHLTNLVQPGIRHHPVYGRSHEHQTIRDVRTLR